MIGPKPPHEYNREDIVGDFRISPDEWIMVAVEDGVVTLATFPTTWEGALEDIPVLSYVPLWLDKAPQVLADHLLRAADHAEGDGA